MRERIKLGGQSKDVDSRYSKEEVINGYIDSDNSGEFRRLARTPGTTDFITLGNGPIRGMHVAADVLYVVSGSGFYRVSVNPVGSVQAELKGTVSGFSGPCRLASIGTDQPEVMALTNTRGFIYKNSDDSFAEVTDLDFDPDFSVTALNQRFWFNKPDSNEFFGSDVLDGFSYDPLFFASAENKPDLLQYVVSLNTELYLMGSSTIERWQDTGASEGFPLRRITGGTINRGLGARASVATWENDIFFLADDFTVRRLGGSGYSKISDLAFEEQIREYAFPDRAEGFVVDNPHFKVYYISFPGEGVTWGYDLTNNQWHKRSSKATERWRMSEAALIFDKVILGDVVNGNLYVLDENEYTEAGEPETITWTTPSISDQTAPFTVPKLEIFAEVGVGTEDNIQDDGQKLTNTIDPEIRLEVSRDGGRSYTQYTPSSLGRIGERDKKIVWRNLGRVKRGQGLIFRFSCNEPVKVEIYAGWITVFKGV